MRRVRSAIYCVVPGLCAGLLVVPAAASAVGAGGAVAPPPSNTPPNAASSPAPAPTATGGALSLTPSSVLVGQTAVATGTLPAGTAGTVLLEVRRSDHRWSTVARATTQGGSFTISWKTSTSGRLTLRAVSPPSAGTATAAASSAVSTPQATLSVYSRVVATWYGPGFYGRHTACGETLTTTIVGVADRTLPCGTPVALSYGGKTLVVPVIDRGPYTSGVTLDLTNAAAEELGITQTVTLGMLPLGGPALAPTDYAPPGSEPAAPTGSTGPTGGAYAGGATAPSS